LDCACGTGDISILLAQSGLNVDAFDISPDMLITAKEKTHNLGLHINYTLQDMCSFKSHNKYSFITCINDGVNYLTTLDDAKSFFNNCYLNMDSGAYLFFDISTEYKLQGLDGEFFAEESEEFAYLWFNEYDYKNHLLNMDLTFFTQVEDDMFKKTYETHIQKAYSKKEITSLLQNCGFSLVNIYSDISLKKPEDKSMRIHFLAQKK